MKEQLTLGQLIAELKKQDQDSTVKFDFCYFTPKGIHSYRGYYDQLAIGYSDSNAPKVKDFLTQLEATVGSEQHGYKGGTFTMTEDTPIWVDEPRSVSGTAIVGVRYNGYQVILETANID